MIKIFTLLISISLLLTVTNIYSEDTIDNYIPTNSLLTEQNRSMLNAIKIAEDNEDWETYTNLRSSFIQEIKESNPKLAKSYRTLQSDFDDFENIDGDLNNSAPSYSPVIQDEEFPIKSIPEKWEDDVAFPNRFGI